MIRSTQNLVGLKALAILAGVLVGPRPAARDATAAPPDGPPGAKARTEVKPPDPVPPPDEPPDPNFHLKDYVFTTDQAIRLFEARVRANSKDVASYQALGEMYERKARESGDLACYEKSEAALRRSLELDPDDRRARATLAAVLCSRHKFAEALAIAEKLSREDPRDIDALATSCDALLELGRYAEAEAPLDRLHRLAPIPPVLARLANLAELKGRTDEATALMRRAFEAASEAGGAKGAAWYRGRLGDLALNAGRIAEAAAHYEAVPEGVDAYHDATYGLARCRAAQGRLDEAIALGEKAVAIGPDPHMLAGLGDLYLKAGKPERARPLFDRLERIAGGRGEYRRELANFYSDHGREPRRALGLAEHDLAERRDVYGHDALAWALYRNGRAEDAARAMADALRLGTRDARLHYHVGMIRLRLGEREEARAHLARALSINPHFSVLQADEAREALAGLGGPPPADASPP